MKTQNNLQHPAIRKPIKTCCVSKTQYEVAIWTENLRAEVSIWKTHKTVAIWKMIVLCVNLVCEDAMNIKI